MILINECAIVGFLDIWLFEYRHYSWRSGHDPSYCRNFGKELCISYETHFDTCACLHKTYKSYVREKFYNTWASPRLRLRRIDQWEDWGKVNPTFLYRNELSPEKQTITEESYGQELPRDQAWKKNKSYELKDH